MHDGRSIPRRLCVVGTALQVIGWLSLISTVVGLLLDSLRIEVVTILCLFAGRGIMKLDASARTLARFCLVVLVVGLSILAIASFVATTGLTPSPTLRMGARAISFEPWPITLATGVAFAGVAYAAYRADRVLRQPEIRALFTAANPSLCAHCGYPATGLRSNRCPECGRPIRRTGRRPGRS